MPSDDFRPTTEFGQPPEDESPQDGVIEVPYQRLSSEALDAILEEFVTREGTDYGDYSYSLADKKAHVLRQLERSEATLLFDPASQTCIIEMVQVLRRHGWAGGSDE